MSRLSFSEGPRWGPFVMWRRTREWSVSTTWWLNWSNWRNRKWRIVVVWCHMQMIVDVVYSLPCSISGGFLENSICKCKNKFDFHSEWINLCGGWHPFFGMWTNPPWQVVEWLTYYWYTMFQPFTGVSKIQGCYTICYWQELLKQTILIHCIFKLFPPPLRVLQMLHMCQLWLWYMFYPHLSSLSGLILYLASWDLHSHCVWVMS